MAEKYIRILSPIGSDRISAIKELRYLIPGLSLVQGKEVVFDGKPIPVEDKHTLDIQKMCDRYHLTLEMRDEPFRLFSNPAPSTEQLRDKFAMAAITGILSNPNWGGSWHQAAEESYIVADAMMKARNRER